MKTPRRLGAHLSVAGGLVSAAQNMISMSGNCLQIFSGSPRSWTRKPLEQAKADAYKTFCKDHNFGPTFIHALYLINLSGDRDDLIHHSIDALTYDLQYSSQIGASGVIVHLGSHLGKGFEAVFDVLVKRMREILDATPTNSTLLIENSAGQKGKLCSDFADIQRLYTALPTYVEKQRLAWCFDTCHGFAAGYDLAHIDQEMKKHDLLNSLKVIHLNDSRDPFNSGRDRHENIGKGLIGENGMKSVAQNPAFAHLPLILEVPGFDGNGPDAKNIEIVKNLI
ncbi:MAG: deoxyribonuclease IV [Patescibacteria group bacterium]